jgi:hypothetical protein
MARWKWVKNIIGELQGVPTRANPALAWQAAPHAPHEPQCKQTMFLAQRRTRGAGSCGEESEVKNDMVAAARESGLERRVRAAVGVHWLASGQVPVQHPGPNNIILTRCTACSLYTNAATGCWLAQGLGHVGGASSRHCGHKCDL